MARNRADWQRYPRRKTAARDYGGRHQKLRAQWVPVVQAGQATCHAVICLMPTRWIPPDQPGQPTGWHLGHTPDRTAWTGPEHERCNESEAAKRGNRMRGMRQRQPVQYWITSRPW